MSWAPRRPSWLSSSGPLIPPSSTSSMASSIRALGAILRSTAWSPLRLARSALEPTPSSLLQRVQDATPVFSEETMVGLRTSDDLVRREVRDIRVRLAYLLGGNPKDRLAV